ncbi:putative salicylate hydroxylase (Salicylate 1-monooxygenase) [Oceanicola granulosus HTCC2516]|uniref:Putative salicylate hydroxylase (Salicylate 1-monooxygenase) n=1 Tax=Oceanicola granulosus (strain ATCC BAA-861 / DSM 15982 / KCTC 12143 / HTCC2516) TaxID=314256 RepID=Q2CHW1_OCEGH|nr:putative salicylate hydroxylase (Salicylate 1-monooxygenase) [Oceanicola granulosus HTCC2516]
MAVIGGGIGGLAAALAFARHGAEVAVFEQAEALREVGAGIQITPNGARVLDALGLGDAVRARGLALDALLPMDGVGGRPVARFDLTGLGGPRYRAFHRADLIELLAEGCRAAGVALHLGRRVEDIAADGSFTAGTRIRPGLTVGADGLRATSRAVLNGAQAPFFTGQVAWRAVIEAEQPAEARIWMAPGRHVVSYPLPGGRLNIVAVEERAAWVEESWHRAADPAALARAFSGMAAPVRALLRRVETVHEWGLFRHPVAGSWSNGRLALLGDAAHPTLPFLAQGANLALEDAWSLAAHWARGDLAGYGPVRRPRVARAIASAERNAVNYHLRGPRRAAAHVALRTLSKVAPRAFLGRMDWLYGHDVTAG